MYSVELRRRAHRALDRLPESDFRAIVEAIEGLAQTPRPRGVEKVRNSDLWRIRKGDYRVVYAIDDGRKLVTVVRVGHRSEIYRSL